VSCNTTQGIRRILCAIDHSEASLRAAGIAIELAGKCQAELIFLGVVQLPDAPQDSINTYLQHEHDSDPPGVAVVESARSGLNRLRDQTATQGGVAVTCEVRAGDPATEIVASATQHAIDLIVVGHRGHNRLVWLVLGSAARKVLEAAPCPVLVVR
jgi:nucleotide-binding universal stress UspA family protein